jgi:uncharacterized protein YndB with AHSA1/START domain
MLLPTDKMNVEQVKITTPSDREVLMTRAFAAPRSLVFEALTTPALVRQWYGPPGWTLLVCEMDVRVGGQFRFVLRRPEGRNIGQRGIYREVTPPDRYVNTESWDDWDAGECLVTTVLIEDGDRTIFSSRMLFPTKEVRDTVLKSGMEPIASALYDKLAALLATAVSSSGR